MKEQGRVIKVSSRKRKKHIGEKLWKSRMLARCFNRTCMDMLSVGVCDRMSVHTLTVLAGEKKNFSPPSISKTCQSHTMKQMYFPSALLSAEICSSAADAEISAHHIVHTLLQQDRGGIECPHLTSALSASTGASVSSRVFLLPPPLWSSVE